MLFYLFLACEVVPLFFSFLFYFFFFATKRRALYCREKILTSSRFSAGLDVMVALLKGLQMNTKKKKEKKSQGWEGEKQKEKRVFF